MFVLNQKQKNIIKKYPISHSIRICYLTYRNIISQDPSISTIDDIVTARFKFESIFLESKRFKTFLIILYLEV